MPKYIKDSSRITVKFIDADTEETITEVKDRNWMNVGELFPASTVSNILTTELKNKKKIPKNILVIAVSEYMLDDE